MTDEMKEKMMQSLLQNARVGQMNVVVESGATVNYYEAESRPKGAQTRTDEEVSRAVRQLMEERDADGGFIMKEYGQWYAVKTVLTSLCGFPVKPSDFQRTLTNLGLDQLRVNYKQESVKKVCLHQLPANVELWHQYQNTADEYSMKQVKVAVRLMELLKNDAV